MLTKPDLLSIRSILTSDRLSLTGADALGVAALVQRVQATIGEIDAAASKETPNDDDRQGTAE